MFKSHRHIARALDFAQKRSWGVDKNSTQVSHLHVCEYWPSLTKILPLINVNLSHWAGSSSKIKNALTSIKKSFWFRKVSSSGTPCQNAVSAKEKCQVWRPTFPERVSWEVSKKGKTKIFHRGLFEKKPKNYFMLCHFGAFCPLRSQNAPKWHNIK